MPLPRIAIFRGSVNTDYFAYAQALAVDHTVDLTAYTLPEGMAVLDLNDPKAVLEWIDANGKEV